MRNSFGQFLKSVDQSLTILCEYTNCYEPNGIAIPAESNLLQVTSNNSLLMASSDFETLLNDPRHSDVKIICGNGGDEFYAHKAILTARSQVFAATFEHDMRERAENVLIIEDLRREVMAELLRYIYCGRVNDIHKFASELLSAADRYALQDLKNRCEEELIKGINVANATMLLVFADLHSTKKLKTEVTAYVISHSKEIVDTTGFKCLKKSHPHLVVEIFEKMASTKK